MTEKYHTVVSYGVRRLNDLLVAGHRVFVTPRTGLSYGLDTAAEEAPPQRWVVLRHRKGEIKRLQNGNPEIEPFIRQMIWYTAGLERQHEAFRVQEDRLDELLLFEPIPPTQEVPYDQRLLRLMKVSSNGKE